LEEKGKKKRGRKDFEDPEGEESEKSTPDRIQKKKVQKPKK